MQREWTTQDFTYDNAILGWLTLFTVTTGEGWPLWVAFIDKHNGVTHVYGTHILYHFYNVNLLCFEFCMWELKSIWAHLYNEWTVLLPFIMYCAWLSCDLMSELFSIRNFLSSQHNGVEVLSSKVAPFVRHAQLWSCKFCIFNIVIVI